MALEGFFPPRPDVEPKVYAYSDRDPEYAGLLKVGYTTRDVAARVAEQYPTLRPGIRPYRIEFEASAMRKDGTAFTDRDVHRRLREGDFANPAGEWFECAVKDVRAAVNDVVEGRGGVTTRDLTFGMRPEQEEAVERTVRYLKSDPSGDPDATPHFLWNAKMRFGKTFAAYQLALRMGWRKLLILTFKPAVQNAWKEDLERHVDFDGWQFASRDGLQLKDVDPARPFVCFGSFQDYLGRNAAGGIKPRNAPVHEINWDCVIFDEYHYGAWRERAKELFEEEGGKERKEQLGEALDYFEEDLLPITTDAYLYLSGTPFRAIGSGEFIEEQIYNWTYSDEQRAKAEWKGDPNPYAALPRMVLMTYQLPDDIASVADDGEFDGFDLNTFFEAKGRGSDATFVHEEMVQKWLDLIRGAHMPTAKDALRLGGKRPPLPFSDARLLGVLNHTFWFLPTVAACQAMANLLRERQNTFFHDFEVVVAAGGGASIMGVRALEPVLKAMGDPLASRTITLSCGKLTTGVSVKPWTGIFMLRNCSSPETYFQAAFRVQTPWTVRNPDGTDPNREEVLKHECYVFDFAPNRALHQIADYADRLNVGDTSAEDRVREIINFLPVLAYDGSSMKRLNAEAVLDYAMSGTSATLLAKRWESALLVNVDDMTLKNLLGNERAMKALMNIEGFRSLNQDLETIINRSDKIKKTQKDANDKEPSKKDREKLTKEQKEQRSLRKQVQEKLVKFATRIPVFMYLTDYREHTLKDVITQIEPKLFRQVTGLTVPDFELLVSLNVFNAALMNDAVYKFKRYEDASLNYAGVSRHEGTKVGLFNTVISAEEFVAAE